MKPFLIVFCIGLPRFVCTNTAGIKAEGVEKQNHNCQKQIAATVAGLPGEKFTANHPVGNPILPSK
jgi:hypothetical protein